MWELAAKIGGDQRFGDEVPDVIDDLGRSNIGSDGNRSFQREIAREDGKATQQSALCFRKQLIAPIKRRRERLMPG